MKKLAIFLLALSLILSTSISTFANETSGIDNNTNNEPIEIYSDEPPIKVIVS